MYSRTGMFTNWKQVPIQSNTMLSRAQPFVIQNSTSAPSVQNSMPPPAIEISMQAPAIPNSVAAPVIQNNSKSSNEIQDFCYDRMVELKKSMIAIDRVYHKL